MDYLHTLKELLPELKDAKIYFEGSKIIAYTKNKEFFLDCEENVKKAVDILKKRIEIRIDPDFLLPVDDATDIIKKTIPKEANIQDIHFELDFSKVIIDVEYPKIAVGENGNVVRELKKKIFWIPYVQRVATPKSIHVQAIRKTLYNSSKFRKSFLNNAGKRIYSAKLKDIKFARIIPLGGCREVGRSCILLQTPNSKIMLDCGISTGASDDNQYPIFDSSDFDIDTLDAIILSHAHLDHCGFIPYLYKIGYKGPLYCTTPTRELAALLQLDTVSLTQKEIGKSIYSSSDIKKMIKHTIPLKYKEVTDITSDMRLIFENAGHLLGSAIIHLNIGNGKKNVIYTGDIKYSVTNLLDPAFTQFPRCEGLIIESTYGGPSDITSRLDEAEKELIRIIEETKNKGGKILIPSFAVGRGQELMIIFEKYNLDIPVYIDGMIWDASAIHSTYPKYLSYNLQKQIIDENKNPFESERFIHIASWREREQVLKDEKPYIVIATSGMLNGGPILEYLKKFCGDKKSSLVFVGYQAEGTLGSYLQKGDKEIEINGEKYNVEINIETIDGLSGHSDRKQLLNYIGHLKDKPQRVIVNHGEKSKTISLANSIQKIFNIESYAPRNLEAIRFL